MKKIISLLNWLGKLENTEYDAIGNDIVLFEKINYQSVSDHPFKVDVTTVIICLKGALEGIINLKPCKVAPPCFLVILPDQILEHKYVSDDFSGLFIVMSKRFSDNLISDVQNRIPLFLSVRENPVVLLTEEELESMIFYFRTLKRIIQSEDHPYRMEVIRYLTLAFFYGAGFHFHLQSEDKKKSNQESLVEKFLSLVQANYKQQRGLGFYANELCLTPKYMSQVVKDTTGKSANDWIDDHVILEAKALLKSTNMTVQQVGDELNFPEQSFFGKYFKRIVGVSPREYKMQ